MTKKKQRAASPRPPDRGAGIPSVLKRVRDSEGRTQVLGATLPPPPEAPLQDWAPRAAEGPALIASLDAAHAAATPGRWVRPLEDEPRAIVSELRPRDSLLALDVDDMAVFGSREDAWAVVALHNAWPVISKRLKEALEAEAQVEPKIAQARAEGLHEAARMVAAKSDLLRKTRGGINKACYELDRTVQDLVGLAGKVVTGKASVTDDHDDARQAMQVITMSAGNIRKFVGREHSIGAKVADDVARIERNIQRLDATIGRIEARRR